MKVVMYCRSSTNLQEHSIEMQRMVCTEYAIRHQLLIDREYIDEEVSARKKDISMRPQLQILIDDIKRGVIKTLIVYKRDRLARNVEQHISIYKLLMEYKIQVLFTASNELPMVFSPIGEFFESMIGAFNQREANQIAMRISDSKQARFLMGKSTTRLPYGYYSTEDKNIARDERKLEEVRKLYNDLLHTNSESFPKFIQNLSYRANLRKSEKTKDHNNLRDIISHPLYKGIRSARFLDETVEFAVEGLAIVSEEEWMRAQEIMKTLIRPQYKKSINEATLLTNLLTCSVCGTALICKIIKPKTGEILVYICPQHYKVKAEVKQIEKIILARVFDYVQLLVFSEHSLFSTEIKRTITSEIKELLVHAETLFGTIHKELLYLTEQWIDCKEPLVQKKMMESYDNLQQLEVQQDKQKKRLQALERYSERVQELWHVLQLDERFGELVLEIQRDLLADIVEGIQLGSEGQINICFKSFVKQHK